MGRKISRSELIDNLLVELASSESAGAGADAAQRVLPGFVGVILRRAEERYLYKHRMTTLGAQLRNSCDWAADAVRAGDVHVRVFKPTVAEHGYELEGHVLETLMPDQPFIFDTLKLLLGSERVRIHNTLSVVLSASFDDKGKPTSLSTSDDDSPKFGYTRFYCDLPSGMSPVELCKAATARLRHSRQIVSDFHRMTRAVREFANEFDYLAKVNKRVKVDCQEVRELLDWLIDDNFVFFGISFYSITGGVAAVEPTRGLGSVRGLKKPSGKATAKTLKYLSDSAELGWPLARVRKSSQNARVHRPGKVDEIVVRGFDDQGQPSGGLVIHGMFTFKGIGETGSTIPILRRKLTRVLELEQAAEGSYESKGVVNAFNALPVEYLFEAPVEVIQGLVQMSVTTDTTRELTSQMVLGEDARSAYVFVVLPKEHFSDDLRSQLQKTLRSALGASYADHRVYLGKFGSVALHFYLTGERSFAKVDAEALREQLADLGTPWSLRLRRVLLEEHGESLGSAYADRYETAFGEAYAEICTAAEAVIDIGHMEKVAETGIMRFDVFESRQSSDEAFLRIYSTKEVLLTDILPVVDNLGIVVAEQSAFLIRPTDGDPLEINTLRVVRNEPDLCKHSEHIVMALQAIFRGHMRSDSFNRLLLEANLSWREVDLLRAYYGYSRQLGHAFAPGIVQKVLNRHSDFVSMLATSFRTRFDPDRPGSDEDRAAAVAALRKQLDAYLDDVRSFEEDRLLRTFVNLMDATIRTNLYVGVRSDHAHFISFKIDSALVEQMPQPRPLFEIYVHHAEVEGVHLRGGRVARGGLRWSDRLDDYRSEVLGLMATQMLKNTVIVPVGAKGGFVLKDPVENWDEARARADRLYRIFIRGLLELTDNIVAGEIVPANRVLRYDNAALGTTTTTNDDAYLVVAADKGTAHLSDTANSVAADFGFWLGDAFASGGSVGYDHKIMAITARGGWVCVRRHFAEMGLDPEVDTITAVGIGDMSGDVFGNGLLLSRTVKLLAAFNHRHIFIDPDPDPETSFAERERLFRLKRSAWTDYAPEVLSEGGGIYDRGAKSIQLSQQAQDILGLEEASMSGTDLIRHILRADVDLLWNGGIGTYVKASAESHADVEDKANDTVRVNANRLRANVLGEGGNLGMTQRARVEFAAAGGRLNLDAIDNSGGVDCSDHEVNLKILLQPGVYEGTLSQQARNSLLEAVGAEVCDMVLENNEGQALGISLDVVRSEADIWRINRAMMQLKRELGFSRHTERLPGTRDVLEHRIARGQGFLRPELGKLMAYAKMSVYQALVEQPLGGVAALRPYLEDYFPDAVVEAHGPLIDRHMLLNEIAATVITSRIVDVGGMALVPTLAMSIHRPVRDIVGAYLLVDELTEAGPIRNTLRDPATAMDIEVRYANLLALEDALMEATEALLAACPGQITLDDRTRYDAIGERAKAILAALNQALPIPAIRRRQARTRAAMDAGLPQDLSRRLSCLRHAGHAIRIAASANGDAIDETVPLAHLYFTVGYASKLLPFADQLVEQAYSDDWDFVAIRSARRALFDSMVRLARHSANHADGAAGALRNVAALMDVRRDIDALLSAPIPPSASFVIGERVRAAVDMLTMSATE